MPQSTAPTPVAYERLSRRAFLRSAGVCAIGFGGLRLLAERGGAAFAGVEESSAEIGFGALRPDPEGVMDLPAGFTYRVISRFGDEMDDGLLVPALADGMAAFPDPDDEHQTIVIRNHENRSKPTSLGPWGERLYRLGRFDQDKIFDRGFGRSPAQGGTTTFVYDNRTGELVTEYLSLAGTVRNCAGGPTPWGSWLTCEEDVTTPDDNHEQTHGWVFEVPAKTAIGGADPKPIEAMGRFNHEAVTVDPRTSIVYLTEDRGDGLLYRFLPNKKGDVHAGGRLQALAVRESPSRDLRNWGDGARVEVGRKFACEWVDLEDIHAPEDDLRLRGFAEHGAARFARLEGCAWADGEAFFVCTNGGEARKGQVFRYRPSEFEGSDREAESPGALELFVEPNDTRVMDMPDNCCVAPWGDLILCEDNGTDNTRLLGVTPKGEPYVLARNAMSTSEFAGACFSPDGQTLFVNIQFDGLTLAVTGPWRR